MGRGRAKAKQTKVARELKYHSPSTDFSRLQAELGSGGPSFAATSREPEAVEDAEDDPYADYAADDYVDEGEDDEADGDSVRAG
jgi:hypothetical protein